MNSFFSHSKIFILAVMLLCIYLKPNRAELGEFLVLSIFKRAFFTIHFVFDLIEVKITDLLSICPVYLTLSSLSSAAHDSLVIVNLGPDCNNPPDWIGLYRQNPSLSHEPPLAFFRTNATIVGKKSYGKVKQFITDVKFGHMHLPWGWDEDELGKHLPKRGMSICLNLFVASYKQNKLQMLDCLKIQPSWMSLEDRMIDTPFREMFIPGTHCSGCYMTKSNMKNQVLKQIGFTQNFNIWQQLVFGIRYLDFSIGYHNLHNDSMSSKNFWIMNGSIRINALVNILRIIKKFVVYSHEPVFMDFNDFPIGFYNHPTRHKELLKLILHELGDVVYFKNNQNNYMNSFDLCLEVMKKRTVIIMYNEPSMLKGKTIICV